MVTADALVEVSGLVLVESIGSEVQHTVVQTLVFQDLHVGRRRLLRHVTLALRHEHTVVQITLVHLPQVDEAEHQQGGDHIIGAHLLHPVTEEQGETDQNHDDRTPCVGTDHGGTHRRDIGENRPCRIAVHALYAVDHLAFLIADERPRHVGEQGDQGRHAGRQGKADIGVLHLPTQQVRLVDEAFQRQGGQQRYGELGDDEDARHGTELRIHRDVIEEEVGESHEVVPP